MPALSGRQAQFYVDLIYGLAFSLGFGYMFVFGMDARVAALQAGLVFGYVLRVWENMSVYERILEEQVAAQAEEAVAAEVDDRVPAEVEDQVSAEVHDRVPTEVADEVETQVADEVEEQVDEHVEEQVDQVAEAVQEQVVDEVEEHVDERVDERLADDPPKSDRVSDSSA